MKRTLILAAIVLATIALCGFALASTGSESNPARAASEAAIALLGGASPEKAASNAAIALLQVDAAGSKDQYVAGLRKACDESGWKLFSPNMDRTWADYQQLQLKIEKVEVQSVQMVQEPHNGAAIARVTARVIGADRNGAVDKPYTLNLGLAENPKRKGDWKLYAVLPDAPLGGN